jgi:hypothetical protein
MTTLHFHQTTSSTPEQFVAGLTDFGPGRSEIFPNSADDYLEVHDQGPDWADVTEGSKGTWERLHYDWSHAGHVHLTTTDSNAWGGASGHTYTFTQHADGTTTVDLVSVREGKNVKGRFFAVLFAIAGQHILGPAFENSVKAIERRSEGRTHDSGTSGSAQPR